MRPRTLIVIRTLLVANGVLLAAVSGLYLVFGSRPAGWVIGGVLGAMALVLWAAVPLADPYRAHRSRYHSSW